MHHGHSRQKHCSPRSLLAEQSKIFVIHVKGVSPGSPLKVSRFSVKRGYQTLRNTRKSPIARMGSHTPGGDSGAGPAQDRNQPHSPGGCRDSRRNQWALILRAGVSPPSSGKGRRTRPRRAPMEGSASRVCLRSPSRPLAPCRPPWRRAARAEEPPASRTDGGKRARVGHGEPVALEGRHLPPLTVPAGRAADYRDVVLLSVRVPAEERRPLPVDGPERVGRGLGDGVGKPDRVPPHVEVLYNSGIQGVQESPWL